MIDYAGKNAFEESHNIRLKAIVGSNTHYLDNIADFNLIESLMSSDTFELGCCESASVSFNMLDDTLKKGDTVQLNLEVEGYDDFNLCKIVIDSVTLSEDKKTRKVIAYDEFYGILNNDYTEFYSNQFGDAESIDFDVFIGAFLTHVGLSHSLNLPKFAIFKVDGTITGSTILNGLFGVLGGLGHLNRNGSLVLLKPNLTVDMQVSNITSGKKMYASCNCKDFATQTFQDAGFYVYEFGSDLPQVIHAGENPYVIKNNIFITDVSKQTIDFNAIYNAYKTFSYVPVDDLYVLGNPCYEVGDTIEIELDDGTKIKTIMFERTLSNIIGMRDEISSKGTEVVEVDNNDLTSKIQQLNSALNVKIEKTAEGILTEVTKTIKNIKVGSTNYMNDSEFLLGLVDKDIDFITNKALEPFTNSNGYGFYF